MNFQSIHNELSEKIFKIPNIENFRQIFENPNKYGNTISHFSFKCNISSNGYTLANFSFEYNRAVLFIPNKGYKLFKTFDVNSIVKEIVDYYKL